MNVISRKSSISINTRHGELVKKNREKVEKKIEGKEGWKKK